MEYIEYYNEYFKIFRDKAPREMVEWGGYQLGEPTGMASSYESCMAFFNYIKNKDVSILDAGAGVSTWMFRKLFKNVISTDPDGEYLKAVKDIVGGENYIQGIENCPVCDYVYWDYGNSVRIPLMELGLNKCRYGMYIDDCHDNEVLTFAKNLAIKNNLEIIELDTLDNFGRWGILIKIK